MVIMVFAFVKLGLIETHAVFACTPLIIAALSGPVLGEKVGWRRWTAIAIGFLGVLIILKPGMTVFSPWAIIPLASAFIWASYSLMTRRVTPFPTAAIGGFALLSGLLSLACHAMLETAVTLSSSDWLLLTLMGLGPMGAAFFLWDRALKTGDARHIGILSYLTPLISTAILVLVSGKPMSWNIAVAAIMIVTAAWLGTRSA